MLAGIILWVGLVAMTYLFPKSWVKTQSRKQGPEFTSWQALNGRFEYLGWFGIALAGAWVVPAFLATRIGLAAFVLCSIETVLATSVIQWYKPWRKQAITTSEEPMGSAVQLEASVSRSLDDQSTATEDGLLNPQVLKPVRAKRAVTLKGLASEQAKRSRQENS